MNLDRVLKKLEKTEYYQRILMVSTILFLVVFIVVMFLFSDIRELYQTTTGANRLELYLTGLLVLSVLLVSYIGLKDRSIRLLRNELIREKTARAVLESEREKLDALLAVGILLTSGVERHSIFNTVCSGLVKCLKGDESSMMLYDSQTKILRCVSYFGVQKELVLGQRVKLGEGVAGWVVKHHTPLLLDKDISQYKFINFVEKERNITSAICVPLELSGEIRGVLNINLLAREDRKFDEGDLRIAKIFAQNAALAIERAQMFETTERVQSQAAGV